MKDSVLIMMEAGTSMFEIILFFVFFNGFLIRKETPLIKEALVLILSFAVQFVIGTWFYDIQFIMLVSSTLVAVFICFSLYEGNPYIRMFSPLLLIAFMAVLELISTMLLVSVTQVGISDVNTNPPVKLVIMIVRSLLGLVAVKVVTYHRRAVASDIRASYSLMMLIVPAISLVISYVILDLIMHSEKKDVSLPITGLLCLMYVNAMIFSVFEGFMRQVSKEYRYQLMEKQMDLQMVHYKQLAESKAHIREIWHDFKNHVQCMQSLYDKGEHASLGEYIANLACYEESANVLDTGNPVVDALISNKQSMAVQNGIEFDMELILPARLDIPPADICSILGNSLDNAIEACARINNPEIEKKISLSLTYKNGHLVLELANTFEEAPRRQGGLFKTWKSSPELHGLGLQSIERTVGQYAGHMKIVIDRGLFNLKIIIPVELTEQDIIRESQRN